MVGKYFYILLIAIFSTSLYAKSPDEGEFRAIGLLADDMARWITNVQPKIKSLSIFAVQAKAPLDSESSTLLETEILKSLAKHDFRNAQSCNECRAPSVTVQEDKLVITKGPFNQEMIQKIGKGQTAEAFLVVDLYRGAFSMTAQAAIYENPSGQVLASERFSATAVTFNESSVQFLMSFGLGKVLVGKVPADTTFAISGNVALLEEIGFAKGGVNIGGILGGVHGTLIHAEPTLSLRGKFGNSGLGWAFWMGAGYGFTNEGKGLVGRLAFNLFLSSLALAGVEMVYMLPDTVAPTLQSFIGLHIGISLGR